MPEKHSDAARIGGPGAAHENRDKGENRKARSAPAEHPTEDSTSNVSGGGGEQDRHHRHDPKGKAGRA